MKKIIFVAVVALLSLTAMAQRVSYNVIAKVPFNAQKEEYGKMEPMDMKIITQDDNYIYIGSDRYDITSVVKHTKDVNTDSKEYSCIDAEGKPFTIKVAYDGTAKHDVMKYFVLIFNDNDIYHWNYYFTEKGIEIK